MQEKDLNRGQDSPKSWGETMVSLFQNHENPLKSRKNRCFRRIVQNVQKKVGEIIVPIVPLFSEKYSIH